MLKPLVLNAQAILNANDMMIVPRLSYVDHRVHYTNFSANGLSVTIENNFTEEVWFNLTVVKDNYINKGSTNLLSYTVEPPALSPIHRTIYKSVNNYRKKNFFDFFANSVQFLDGANQKKGGGFDSGSNILEIYIGARRNYPKSFDKYIKD